MARSEMGAARRASGRSARYLSLAVALLGLGCAAENNVVDTAGHAGTKANGDGGRGGGGAGGAAGDAAGRAAGAGRGGGQAAGGTGGNAGANGGAVTAGEVGNEGGAGVGIMKTQGVTCGDGTCSLDERCSLESNGDEVECVTAQSPCATGGGCILLDCDGPEDCESGEGCRYTLGESSYFQCVPGDPDYGRACTDASDCAPEYPECIDLNLTDEQLELIGWRPRYCSS